MFEQVKSLTVEAELADITYGVTQDNLAGVPLPTVADELEIPMPLDELPIMGSFDEISAYVHFSSERSDQAREILVGQSLTVAVGVEVDEYNGDDSGLFGHSELVFDIAAPEPWAGPDTEPAVHMYVSTGADFDEQEVALIDKLEGGDGDAFARAKDNIRDLELELPKLLAMIVRPKLASETPVEYLSRTLDRLYDLQRLQLNQTAITKMT
ncbi:hypothetical protein KC957_00650 [Candidatus Saccharibacteria bacterium]|nr:hypothetical protein [Candidatus Saccharibacteria bacterium]